MKSDIEDDGFITVAPAPLPPSIAWPEGRKDDADKPRMDLIPPEVMTALGTVLSYGAKKYTTTVENEWHRLLLAPIVETVRLVTPSGDAVSVTKSTSGKPILSLQNASDKTGESGKQETQNGSESWPNVARTILRRVQETQLQADVYNYGSSASLQNDTKNSAPSAAQFAGPRNTCTLTIVTKQGDFEVSFAPDAITDLAFWTTTWKGLNARFGISAPVSQTGERNWEAGMRWGRPFAAMMRHMWAWWRGEEADAETGMSHLWHAACCLTFLISYEARKIGEDDRKVLD